MSRKRILIAGGSGRLGRALRERLREHEVSAPSHAEMDVTKSYVVREAVAAFSPDIVLNAAGYTKVDEAESNRHAAMAVNATGARNVAIAADDAGVDVLYVSTDYVFAGVGAHPFWEHHRPNPLSVYGESKFAGERETMSANARHFIVRTAWLYDIGSDNFATRMAAKANHEVVQAVSNQWGSPTYAPHLADAIEQLIETERYGIHHIAGSGTATWCEFTGAIFDAIGSKARIEVVPSATFPRPARRPVYAPLISAHKDAIVLPPWQDGVREFARQWMTRAAA